MNMSRNEAIFVIVDPGASHHAGLVKAALIAKKSAARIDLFACSSASSADEIARAAETSAMLRSLARPLRELGLEVTTETIRAESLRALAECLKQSCAQMVIKDVYQDADSGNAELTCSDWELARVCPISLLLSKATLWPALPKICIAIDPGHRQVALVPLEHSIMEQGRALAERLDGELHALHACMPPAVTTVAAADAERVTRHYRDRLASLESLMANHRVSTGQVHVGMGGSGDVLSRLVGQLEASIVVMGAVSRSPLRKNVIGSTAENLLRQLPCDVLLVKAPQAASVLH